MCLSGHKTAGSLPRKTVFSRKSGEPPHLVIRKRMTALNFDQIEVLQRDFLQQESLDEFSTTKGFLPATVENRPGLSKLLVVG